MRSKGHYSRNGLLPAKTRVHLLNFTQLDGGSSMDLSLGVLRCLLVLLEFVEFLVTPLGLSAGLFLLFWSTFMISG
ncbi:hypothetical protein [Aphanothece sacrum]|uniref:hypothetical protein n=1 Tax=Aphanothece sacrum TaxID=1122 RepID=UPI000F612472|nr:hypothetical protein [Aphanothece sacrum]GBF86402.1 phosphatidylethanolamine methyltransferase PemT [Aphanothece sacrum FPU3]